MWAFLVKALNALVPFFFKKLVAPGTNGVMAPGGSLETVTDRPTLADLNAGQILEAICKQYDATYWRQRLGDKTLLSLMTKDQNVVTVSAASTPDAVTLLLAKFPLPEGTF